jgi:adenine/guanine/hypoxanthine permease
VGEANLVNAGVIYKGLLILGSGAILAGLILGAAVTFIIDRRFVPAAIFAFVGSALSFIGLIHAEKVQWNANGEVALGYLFMGLVCLAFAATHPTVRVDEESGPVFVREELAAGDARTSPTRSGRER